MAVDPPSETPAPTPAPAPGRSSADLSEMPRRPSRWTTWLLMMLLLALAGGAMTVGVSEPDVVDPDEARVLAVTTHSWQMLGERNGDANTLSEQARRLIPWSNGRRRLDLAPLTWWVHRIAFTLTPDAVDGDIDTLVLAARRSAMLFGLLTVAAVFWLGFSIGGQRAAVLAALICIAHPAFIYHARIAAPAIYHTGLAALSIAAALWAIRPLKPPPSAERQLIGWVICGLALGAATLTVGPITGVTIIVPIVILMLICQDRVGHLMGLLAAMFMGLLIVLPWIIYAHEQDPTSWQQWMLHLSTAPVGAPSVSDLSLAAGRRVLLAVIMVLPWPLWFIALAVQPFSTSSQGRRIRLILGAIWFVLTVAVLIAMPAGSRMGNLLPALPASAVALGQLFNHYADLASAGRYARFWRWLRWPHLLVLIAGSLLVPVMLFAEPPIGDWPHVTALLRDVHQWPAPAAVIVALLIPVGFSIRYALSNYPSKAAIVWALWTILLSTVVAFMVSRSDLARSTVRQDAERIDAIAGDTPVYWYAPNPPNAATRLYTGRALPKVNARQVRQAADEAQPFVLLLPEDTPTPDERLTDVRVLSDLQMRLWRFDPGS